MTKPGSRQLFEDILAYEGPALVADVLQPWAAASEYAIFLAALPATPSVEENWELYALSRVLDVLTLRWQPNNRADGSDWPGPDISLAEYQDFISLLGLEAFHPVSYHPFASEILAAQAGAENFKLADCFFPGIRLRNKLLKRAGLGVLLNPADYNLALVNGATGYWTYRRKNRPYRDLSHGWGNNSQWRTALRLDCETADAFCYNPQGRHQLHHPTPELLQKLNDENLTLAEAIELTVNRQFITCAKDDTDLFPYDFAYEQRKDSVY